MRNTSTSPDNVLLRRHLTCLTATFIPLEKGIKLLRSAGHASRHGFACPFFHCCYCMLPCICAGGIFRVGLRLHEDVARRPHSFSRRTRCLAQVGTFWFSIFCCRQQP